VPGTFKPEIKSQDPQKPPHIHNGRYLVLCEKVDGDWKMLRDMDNADPVDLAGGQDPLCDIPN